MRKSFHSSILCLALAFSTASPAFPMQASSARARSKADKTTESQPHQVATGKAALLPSTFAGWQREPDLVATSDAAQADPADAAALKEYGFTDAVLNTYARDGEALKIKALRFADASGAYGAYTLYRHSNWPKADVGTGGASDNDRVIFWRGNIVVDATFSHISAMSASELRELASALIVAQGNKSLPPPILSNLPHADPHLDQFLHPDPQTTHYALGPAGYAASGGVLPASIAGFDKGAEAVSATYSLRSGPATLTIVNYPTPQIATAQEKVISTYINTGKAGKQAFTRPLQDSNPAAIEVRRSGPLVAIVSGDAIPDEAHKLVTSVHYEADTANLPGQRGNEVQKTAQLILGIVMLVVVMFAAAVGVALFLGGGRAAYRFLRGKPLSSVHDAEFTSLDLRE